MHPHHSDMEHEGVLLNAPQRAELCPTCDEMLNPQTELKEHYFQWRKQTLEEFKDAVSRKCAICNLIWNLTDDHPQAWLQLSSKSWEQMRFHYNWTSLSVIYSDPVEGKQDTLSLKFMGPEEDSEYKKISSLCNVQSSTSSALDMAYDWFTTCTSGDDVHDCCTQSHYSKPGWYPTRLIDIGNDSETNWNLRVVSQDGLLEPDASYMTLSYRWGSNPTLLLLSSNIDTFRSGSPICNLPLTFREFITVARRFSIRYVWIDALCIIQDSIADWEAEAPTMRYVYANSACNIAASASYDPEGGLFRDRDPESLKPICVSATLFSGKPQDYYLLDKHHRNREIRYGPLNKRGWVYQEILLAPRVLYFSVHKVLWECFADDGCEFKALTGINFPTSNTKIRWAALVASLNSKKGQMSIKHAKQWMTVVEEYSKCVFTRPSDKLFAFSGIAKLFQHSAQDVYIAGLWKSRLVETMDWYVDRPQPLISSKSRAPSWSWASLDGPVRTGPSVFGKYVVEVLDVQFIPGADPTADVSNAYVKLKAGAVLAICQCGGDKTYKVTFSINGYQLQNVRRLHLDSSSIMLKTGRKVTCLLFVENYKDRKAEKDRRTNPIASVECLILDQVGSDLPTKYRRLGIMGVYDEPEVSFLLQSVSTTEVTIV